MSWYRTGTVVVTNGSKTVTGVGTLFTTAVNAGDAFALVDANGNPTDAWYEVEAVTSNTALVLKQTYAGSTGSNKQYVVFNLVGNMTTPSFAQRLATFFASFQSLIDKPTTTPTAASIPIADSSGDIADGWIPATVARLASPTFTGTPAAPTAAKETDTTQLATTAFVKDVVADYAPLESPALTGSPTAPTQAASDDSTKLATTAYVKNQVASDTVAGMVELATPAEVLAGTDNERAVTPAGFKAAFGEFYPFGVTPTYVDSTHFTVSGDLTAIFTQGRVLKITDTGGTFNAICATSAYDAGTELTTVTVAGETIDSGISAVLYSVQQHTGAVIESGSNANGNYTKFADGTMICSIKNTVTDQAIDASYGSFYIGARTWTFPAVFAENAVVTAPSCKWGTGASWASINATSTTTSVILRFLDVLSRSTGTEFTYFASAIGRWY